MQINDLVEALVVQLLQATIPEAIAVIFSVASVLLARANNAALYPTGIISTGLFTWVMWEAGLYAESWLNGYYFIMSIYGWWLWNKNREHKNPRAITKSKRSDWTFALLIVIGGWALLFFILNNYTDSNVPMIDALVASTAWAGMWLLAKHKLENWIFLNISNLIAIPLQFYKGIPLTAFLTLFLFIVAIFGYLNWRKLCNSYSAT